jgi:hypothetical protein
MILVGKLPYELAGSFRTTAGVVRLLDGTCGATADSGGTCRDRGPLRERFLIYDDEDDFRDFYVQIYDAERFNDWSVGNELHNGSAPIRIDDTDDLRRLVAFVANFHGIELETS